MTCSPTAEVRHWAIWKTWAERLLLPGVLLCAVMAFAVWRCNSLVVSAAKGTVYDRVEDLPDPRTVLLMGCVKTLASGYSNPFFQTRIEAAAKLYAAGKAPAIIVSGDNHICGYDEPTDMKRALIQAGVPADKIYCDYAGFRSLDSVVRAKKVFGQDRVIVVSQRFHNERSLYLAQRSGLDAVAFNAAGIRFGWALKTYIREAFARVKAVLDVDLLGVEPKFLGPAVSLDEPPQDAQP